jgi:TolB-like protein
VPSEPAPTQPSNDGPVVAPAPARAASKFERWRRRLGALRSRFARQIALVTLVLGGIVAVGHVLGGMIGWWHAWDLSLGAHKPAAAPRSAANAAPTLSLVVLPLVNEGQDTEGDWFADMLAGDLTLRLSMVSGALVISRDTAFTYKGRRPDARQVAQDLGVRYVVQGGVARDGERLRLRLALVDGSTGAQRWAQQQTLDRARLDASLDEITAQLARELNLQLYRAAGERAAALAPAAVQADDLAMQGWAAYLRGFTRDNLQQSLDLFERAVTKDPKSLRGWGGVAVANGMGASLGWSPDRQAAIERLELASRRLQALDENDWFAWLARSNVANLQRDYESHLLIADAMAERFPSQPQPHFNRGLALLNLGRLDECVEPTLKALRIGPRDTQVGIWHWQIATCQFMRAQYKEAAHSARAASLANPALPLPPLTLAAALVRDGRADEARRLVADYRQRHPAFEAAHLERYMRSSEPRYVAGRQQMIDSLRELGMQ